MRVFVTGATGFIGKAVVQELIGAGHAVVGLARSAAGAAALQAAGATPHAGSLSDPDSLRRGAVAADGVVHLAFIHGLGDFTPAGRLRLLLGGSPGRIPVRFMAAIQAAERGAINAMGAALAGSGRPMVTTFAAMGLPLGRLAVESDGPDLASPGGGRAMLEAEVEAWASRGVRATMIRLPPAVHDTTGAGFVDRLVAAARKSRSACYADEGANRWGAVHRLDAARLFRLSLERGAEGARYHGVAEEGVPMRQIAEAIGRRLDVPVVRTSQAATTKALGWIAPFALADNPVSSRATQAALDWTPTQTGLLEDIGSEAYVGG